MHGADPLLPSHRECGGTPVLQGAGLRMCREGQGGAAGERRSFTARTELRLSGLQREHTSHSDTESEQPRFPCTGDTGSLCSFHAGSTFPALHNSGAAGRAGQPQEQRAKTDSTLVLALHLTGPLRGKAEQGDSSVPAAAAAAEPEQLFLGMAGADVFLWSCYAPAPRCSWVHYNPCVHPQPGLSHCREWLLHGVLFQQYPGWL